MSKQRTTISIETKKMMVVRPAGAPIDLWCESCAAIVSMYLPERAAALSEVASREIYRLVESGELHFVETDAGELLICSWSLRGETGESSKALVRARAKY
jgi:hypothetical protein